jgi:hypothetical protein
VCVVGCITAHLEFLLYIVEVSDYIIKSVNSVMKIK